MTRLKQAVCLFLCGMFLLVLAPRINSYSSTNYIVYVNGVMAQWDEIGPFMRLGRLMVPLGGFGSALGAEVQWDENKKEAFLLWQGRYAWAQVSNPTLYYGTYVMGGNGRPLLTDVSPLDLPVEPNLQQHRMSVPLASLVEAFGGQLIWDEVNSTANVTIPLGQAMPVGQPTVDSMPQLMGPPMEPSSDQTTWQSPTQPPVQDFGQIQPPVDSFGQIQPSFDGSRQIQPPVDNFGQQAPQVEAAPERENYFQLFYLDEALVRYENDDPFVLISFDNNLPSVAMYEVLKAAADLRVKVYGLDLNKNEALNMLPFAEDAGEVTVYFVNGYGRVKTVGDPDYTQAVEELLLYMESD